MSFDLGFGENLDLQKLLNGELKLNVNLTDPHLEASNSGGQINLFDANSDYYEVNTDNIDLAKLHFKVHASVIYKLGESLIADEITALSELLKNAYDADASYCKLMIDPDYTDENRAQGKITITDNGCGMDLQTIVSGWLTISNSPKKRMKNNKETTPKHHRIPLGEKGLGRLSVQKLGRKVTMVTKIAENPYEYAITIPWNEFLENTTLDQINIPCERREVLNSTSYTTIIITDLINPQYWKLEENIKGLEKTIGKIVSPFKFRDSTFIISASVGNYKVDVSNSIFQDVLSTARCIYSFDVQQNEVQLSCKYKLDFFKRRKIEKDYAEFSFQRDYFQEMYSTAQKSIDNLKYYDRGDILFEATCTIPLVGYSELIRNPQTGAIYHPGNFDGEIFDFYYDKTYLASLIKDHALADAFSASEYAKYVKDNKGIKVIRDGFVVQGYGDGDVDWLGLSASATTTGRYGDLNNESVIGYVRLTGANNQSLKETTSREGFVADEYYRNFYALLRNVIIRKINSQNQKMMAAFSKYLSELFPHDPSSISPVQQIEAISNKATSLSQLVKKQFSESKKYAENMVQQARETSNQTSLLDNLSNSAQKQYEEIIEKQSNAIAQMQKEITTFLSEVADTEKQITQIRQEIDRYQQKIGDVFELAGLGISVELFTHELYTTINNVNEKIGNIPTQTEELRYIQNAMNSLRKQLSYFHPGLKYVRMKKENVSLASLISNHLAFYKTKCETQNIHQTFINCSRDIVINANTGLLNQVFDNLFSNSFYWLLYSRDTLGIITDCEYTIEVLPDGTINVWDNGIGISKDVENDLFNPFVSCKQDGRGLGLFICKNNLENNGASIRLLRERNKYENLYKFQIDLSNLQI